MQSHSTIEEAKETSSINLEYIKALKAASINLLYIKTDPFCEDWLNELKPDNRLYPSSLARFCAYYSITPEELSKLPVDDLKKKIRQYIAYLKKIARPESGKNHRNGQPISVNTVRPYVRGVQSFTEHLEITLPWAQMRKALPEEVPSLLRAYRREEVQQLLVLANERERVAILVMVSSGIRVGAFPELTFKNIIRLGPEYGGLAFLLVYGKSSKKYQYLSLLSPEALQAIDEYKALRERHGEKVGPDSALIIEDLWYRTEGQRKAVKSATIGDLVKKLIIKAKLPLEELQPDHAFRKFFNTSCVIAHIDNLYKETMLGHSIDLDDVYLDVDDPKFREEIVAEYKKVLYYITISDSSRGKLDEMKAKSELEEVKKNSAPRGLIESLERQVMELKEKQKVSDGEAFKRYILEWAESPEGKALFAKQERQRAEQAARQIG